MNIFIDSKYTKTVKELRFFNEIGNTINYITCQVTHFNQKIEYWIRDTSSVKTLHIL